jgi:hypothetical protein
MINTILVLCIIIAIFYLINQYLQKKKKNKDKEEYFENNYILPKTIYGYWDNLDTNPLIQAHIDTWKRNVPKDWDIVILTKDNVKYHVDEEFYEKFKDLNSVRFSDFLRVYLLSKNGGVWMDAGTIVIDGSFLDKYRDEMIEKKGDVLLYEFKDHSLPNHPYLENWFIMAPKGSNIITDLYEEFDRAYDMDFYEYKVNVLAPNIDLSNTIKYGESTYHLQHSIFIYLLQQNPDKYNMLLKDPNESMFKAQEINDWKSDKLIDYIINNDDWSNYYAIKLVGFNRSAINDSNRELFIKKLNSF